MARHAKCSFTLPDGRIVGYGFKTKYGILRVQFPDPNRPGKYLEASTGTSVKNDAYTAAAKIILKAYQPTLPLAPKAITWKHVADELEKTPGLRPDTKIDYGKCLSLIAQFIPDSKGPSDITPEIATKFKRNYASTPFVRGPKGTPKQRSANTVRSTLNKMSCLWNKHLTELGYVKDNPWEDVTPPPATKKLPFVPSDNLVNEFITYLRTRYPEWKLLRLWVDLKCLTASRTADPCSLRSSQLVNGRIEFAADQTKGRAARAVPLPPSLFAELKSLAGPTWLWESFVADARRFRPSKNVTPPDGFDPEFMQNVIENIFKEFNESRPDQPRLTPHSLRRRAITKMTVVTQSIDATAQAIGVDPQTARRHYLDAARAYDTDALFRRVAGELLPSQSDRG